MPGKMDYPALPPLSTNKSIAVLPFVNMSNDTDNEYFSDGITEEIINALTKVRGLKVIARTSSFAFKNKNIDIRTIGKQLGVQTILEGSIRKSKKRVRITAQLINTIDGTHFWSKNYDRELEDIFELQDEISLLIADQIRENFGHFMVQEHLVETPTQNVEAYNLYLKGRYHHLKWNADDLILGVKYYEQSIQADPNFALPYFSAGLCYGINASWGFIPYKEGIQQSLDYLDKGMALNDQNYLGFFARATIYFWGKWDFKKGHYYLLQSIELNPSFTEAEEGLAELYTAIGAFEKAMEHTSRILSLNPLSPNHYYTKGNIFYLSQNYEQAIVSMKKALQIDPQFALAIEIIAACYIHLKDYQKLIAFLDEYQAENPVKCKALYSIIHKDEQTNLEMPLTNIKSTVDHTASLIPWHLYLNIYLGNHELALNILEKGVAQRAGQFINLKNDPFLAPLREHKRFKKIIRSYFSSDKLPEIETTLTVGKNSSTSSYLSKEEAEAYLQLIYKAMKEEQLFINAELSLKILAEKIGLHPNKLSWLINEFLKKNFNELINSYRLDAFKQKALNPANAHLTLLGLAYESGFNSKTAFNTYFKKSEGMTPRAWIKMKTQ